MVASAPQSQSQSQSQPPSAEEETLRRSTDCVYFLASPLTCKKGGECEYRHSDTARVNPWDCWFWLNGNCLNAKCGFRHPPLDGLLGAQTPASSGPSAHMPSNVTAPAPTPAPAAHSSNAFPKQGVACIYFQKGFCVKGDWCPFLHGPNSLGNKASLVTATTSAAEPTGMAKKVSSGIENSLQEKKALPINAVQSVKDSQQAKPITKVEPSSWGNGYAMNKKLPQTSGNHEFTAYQPTLPVSNGRPVHWSSHVQQSHLLEEPESMYSKDTEEVSREPSPGFDVLVDDEGRDSDYYAGEDRYGMSVEHDDRNEYDRDRSTDFNMIAIVDGERYGSSLGYDSHDLRTSGQYAWEQHRDSSERIPGGAYIERRSYDRPNSRGRVDESDLRHRLAKHRKPNSLRSVINREHDHDMKVGDRSYPSLHRDEKVLSGRLRGRIRIPRRSLSPIRSGIPSTQGRIQNRIKGRLEEPFNNAGGNHRGMRSRQDTVGDNNTDFAGPKSLAELKHRKNAEPTKQQVMDQQSIGKRKHLAFDGNQQSGGNRSFEGPKPLEEILKRKRGETIGNTLAGNSSNNQGATEDENCEQNDSSKNEVHNSSPAQNTYTEETRHGASNSSEQPVSRKLEGDDMPAENQVTQETKSHKHREDEHEHDQVGGEDYDLFDGENGVGSGEYADEDDDDDDEFAKKMGVVYS